VHDRNVPVCLFVCLLVCLGYQVGCTPTGWPHTVRHVRRVLVEVGSFAGSVMRIAPDRQEPVVLKMHAASSN
jgi:hypothetical protein